MPDQAVPDQAVPDQPADYLDRPVGRFLDALSATTPDPSGGAVAALAVAFAAGLCVMVAGLSARHLPTAERGEEPGAERANEPGAERANEPGAERGAEGAAGAEALAERVVEA